MSPDTDPRATAARLNAENDLYREVVVEHKRAPRHFGHLASPTNQARGHNPQCGDNLTVEVQVAHGQLLDLAFEGEGCAICIASASMMSEAVAGKDVEHARALHRRFRAVLIGEQEPGDAELGKLASLAGVRRYPSRIKCALLGWHALMHALADADGAKPETAL